MTPVSEQHEWLEADGLGGFASGTTSGIRTRRYHALWFAADGAAIHRRKRTKDSKSLVLWLTMGAHRESAYLKAIAITRLKMKIVADVSARSICRAIQPGR